ncbi:argininosuccinate lyase [Actinosynnema pretiosum subsp. pretiosum]|uniref:argininosuccinate lyase n=1 Tax=Actinosynnema pretiosum subsp. pretiosum TaxID=103721 RepID=A0AA45L6M4_9PSEU|nr:Argininosuccinate lyase [Actinosynnema pretiosum subsp. pretiosum]QUF04145.1 argininosuccinate lyase [Actinosynnema pretiosum subsp. pretiosum]
MTALTGRLSAAPSTLLDAEVLRPQFEHEVRRLLPHYVAVERVLALEYRRMGLLTEEQAADVLGLLARVRPDELAADPEANLSDIAFALERHVERGAARPVPNWHVDRSRNDLQACAQLMAARDRLAALAGQVLGMAAAARRVAARHLDTPMPGCTHYQAAQVTTPGFHLAALGERLLHTSRRLLATFDGTDACPLGAGALTGQHLPWDRERMAALLGFTRPGGSALTDVASRAFVAEITAELSLFGITASRFATDLITWAGAGHGFVDLPDELSGISSAMPQKKNFPVLERIRGRTAHLTSCHVDVALAQRGTPYTNLVEVSKEAGAQFHEALDTAGSVVRLFTAVLDGLVFRADRMRAACEREYLGGFALATLLTLRAGVPWRRAQVLAGRYVVAALERGLPPTRPDGDLLAAVAEADGVTAPSPGALLAEAFDVDASLRATRTTGSAHPDEVAAQLRAQDGEHAELERLWAPRRARLARALDTGALDTGALDTGALDTGVLDTGASGTRTSDVRALDTGARESRT